MSADPVVLDTSIWIEYFRGRQPRIYSEVDSLIQQRRLLHLHVVGAELVRGARTTTEQRVIHTTVGQIPLIFLTDNFWVEVGAFCFALARKGCVPSLVDAWIAKAVIAQRCALWSLDRHFENIARYSPLVLHRPE